jgi:hypothetical protein
LHIDNAIYNCTSGCIPENLLPTLRADPLPTIPSTTMHVCGISAQVQTHGKISVAYIKHFLSVPRRKVSTRRGHPQRVDFEHSILS